MSHSSGLDDGEHACKSSIACVESEKGDTVIGSGGTSDIPDTRSEEATLSLKAFKIHNLGSAVEDRRECRWAIPAAYRPQGFLPSSALRVVPGIGVASAASIASPNRGYWLAAQAGVGFEFVPQTKFLFFHSPNSLALHRRLFLL